MALQLSNYRYFSPRPDGEGLRIGCTRYLVRGMKKADYARENVFDVWLPVVAPSAELLRRVRDGATAKAWERFERAYRREMDAPDPRHVLNMLAKVAEHTPIAVGCYCEGPRCHRFILETLIRGAASEPF